MSLKIDEKVSPIALTPEQHHLVHIQDNKYPQGEHNYSLTLIDMANNQTVVKSRFTVDYTPPVLTADPVYINTLTDYLPITGTYQDLTLDKIYSGRNQAIINHEENSYAITALWNYNERSILLNAIDKARNTSELIVPVIYDTEPPMFTNLIPVPGMEVRGWRVRVEIGRAHV